MYQRCECGKRYSERFVEKQELFDLVTVTCRGGDGGDGCVHFRREKYVPRGGPDGGRGGSGGDVILKVAEGLHEFSEIGSSKVIKAEDGGSGAGNRRSGRRGKDRIVRVPAGTVVFHCGTGRIVKELNSEGERVIIARGGRGGKGNADFASSTNQVPVEFEEGCEGEEIKVRLDLKLIADIGLIGFPNAGKSTLLNRLTGAAPQVADYPFTTLDPKLGIIVFDDYKEAVIADIPGIIENARKGKGLGNRFLKHIERTAVLIHVVECIPFQGIEPFECYEKMRDEIKAFNPDIAEKEEVVVLNKIDTVDTYGHITAQFSKAGVDILPISAEQGTGIEDLKKAIRRKLDCMNTGAGITFKQKSM